MSAHKSLSASQSKRWMACPGSAAMLETRESAPSGESAMMGTAAHWLAEEVLKSGGDVHGYAKEWKAIDVDENGDAAGWATASEPKHRRFAIDSGMADAVECFIDYVRKRQEELGGDLTLEGFTNPLPERDDTGGTADVTINAWPDELEVVDYKHGSGVFVPVEGNEQLWSYLLGRAEETRFSHDRYRCTIVQPRHMNAPRGGVMSEELTREQLLAFRDRLAAAAERVDEARDVVDKNGGMRELNEAGLLSAGEDGSHCFFCPLKNECPAAIGQLAELAQIDFADDPADLEMPGENRLAVLLPWVPFVDKWVRDLQGEAEKILMAGGKIDGFKLVRKRSYRQWSGALSEAEIVKMLVEDFQVDKEDLFSEPKLVSGPQAEKLIDKERRGEFNDKMLVKPEGGLAIAPEDDKRPAVDADPGKDFEDAD